MNITIKATGRIVLEGGCQKRSLEKQAAATTSNLSLPLRMFRRRAVQSNPPPFKEAMIKMLDEAGEDAKKKSPTAAPQIRKIQAFAFLLRENKHFKKYYEPRAVSLGPIHYGKPKYHLTKLILASEFIKDSGKARDELYKKIEDNIKEPRECYEEEVTKEYNDEDLTWMLFMDGCAILQYIYCATTNKFKDLNIKNDCAALGQQDLFLLENQLPYRLLKRLMKLSVKKKELKKSINDFIKSLNMGQADQQSERQQAESLHSKKSHMNKDYQGMKHRSPSIFSIFCGQVS